MRRSILFYVSSHGYGHATRVAAIVAALLERDAEVVVHVRTLAPGHLFGAGDGRLKVYPVAIDSPVVESEDALRIDVAGTMEGLRQLVARRDEIVAREVAFLRAERVGAIYADIPFLAGEIAEAAGIECTGISNFTWNWILGPHLKTAEGAAVLAAMEAGYGKYRALWQLPFGHEADLHPFAEVRQMPLVTRRPRLGAAEVRARLGLESERRPVVLVALRNAPSAEALRAMERQAGEYCLLTPPAAVGFSDALAMADVVLGKLGYGLVAECCAARKPLLYVPREGFREDAITRVQARSFIPMAEVTAVDFAAGRWGDALSALLREARPDGVIDATGAEVCAAAIRNDFDAAG